MMYIAHIQVDFQTPHNPKVYRFFCALCEFKTHPNLLLDYVENQVSDHLERQHFVDRSRVEFRLSDDKKGPVVTVADVPKCMLHGVEGCEECSRIYLDDLNVNSGCIGCNNYGRTGMHRDTCPRRIGKFYANKDEAVAAMRREDLKKDLEKHLNLAAIQVSPEAMQQALDNIMARIMEELDG